MFRLKINAKLAKGGLGLHNMNFENDFFFALLFFLLFQKAQVNRQRPNGCQAQGVFGMCFGRHLKGVLWCVWAVFGGSVLGNVLLAVFWLP